jgi:hypothetical protein
MELDKEQTAIIVEASYSAGFNDCRQRMLDVLNEAMRWPITQKLKPAERRRDHIRALVHRVAKLRPIKQVSRDDVRVLVHAMKRESMPCPWDCPGRISTNPIPQDAHSPDCPWLRINAYIVNGD